MPIKFHNVQKNELGISKSLKSILLYEIRIRRSGAKLHSSNLVKYLGIRIDGFLKTLRNEKN